MGCGEMKFSWLCLALIILPNLGGWVGGIAVHRNDDWYKGLNISPFSPPGWVFGPVWTILYCLMGFASYLVWIEKANTRRQTRTSRKHPESDSPESQELGAVKTVEKPKNCCSLSVEYLRRKSWIPMTVYLAQLLLNWGWVWIFFEARTYLWALIELLTLDITAMVCMICFGIVRPVASFLLIPYMLWLILATYLNFYVYLNNEHK